MRTDYPGLTVDEWVAMHGRGSMAELARRTGAHWRTIQQIAQGHSTPSPRLAVAIEFATKGQCRAEKLLGLGELRRQAETHLGKLRDMGDYREARVRGGRV